MEIVGLLTLVNQINFRATLNQIVESLACNIYCDNRICFQIWAGPLSGQRLAVVLWNRGSKASTITVKWDVLGLESSISVSIKDLWKVSKDTLQHCIDKAFHVSVKKSGFPVNLDDSIYTFHCWTVVIDMNVSDWFQLCNRVLLSFAIYTFVSDLLMLFSYSKHNMAYMIRLQFLFHSILTVFVSSKT